MRYDEAIDLAFKLNNDEDDDWTYKVVINATTQDAKIEAYDEHDIYLGTLGDNHD